MYPTAREEKRFSRNIKAPDVVPNTDADVLIW